MYKGVRNRSLQPEEVEIRVDSIAKSGKSFTVVPYIKKETAWNYLDELYGAGNWDKQITMDRKSADTPFYSICRIHVHSKDADFYREDAGEGDSPKSAASDALKRAAMNIIPSFRALGTVPTLRIRAEKVAGILDLGADKSLNDALKFAKFKVLSISFGTSVSGEFVKALTIGDEETGAVIHEFINTATREYRKELAPETAEKLADLKVKMAEAHVTEEQMISIYGVESLVDIIETEKRYNDALINLEGRAKKLKACKQPAKQSVSDSISEQLGTKRKNHKEG